MSAARSRRLPSGATWKERSQSAQGRASSSSGRALSRNRFSTASAASRYLGFVDSSLKV
jgi:hypothetical protein